MKCFQKSKPNVFIPFQEKEVVETKNTRYRNQGKRSPWIEYRVEVQTKAIHEEIVKNRVEKHYCIRYPQIWSHIMGGIK